jgi:hypothetical protein
LGDPRRLEHEVEGTMELERTAAARARIIGGRGGPIERSLLPIPYEIELIVEDVAYAGRGAHVEIDVDGLTPSTIAELESCISAVFARRHVDVRWSGRPESSTGAR